MKGLLIGNTCAYASIESIRSLSEGELKESLAKRFLETCTDMRRYLKDKTLPEGAKQPFFELQELLMAGLVWNGENFTEKGNG